MEIRLSYSIFFSIVQLVIFTVASLSVNDCRLCKPGYYASRLCSETHDTVCKPCSAGTFSPKSNVLRQCSPCSKCNIGEFVFKWCSKSKNTVCKLCETFNGSINHNFIHDCRHSNIDQSKVSMHSIVNGIVHKRHKRNEENDKNNIIAESSGESIIEEIEAINATREMEGSGIISEGDDINDINATYVTLVLLPENGDNEDKTGAELTTFTVTTVNTEVIEESGEGIILKNTSSDDVDKPNVILTGRKNNVQQTTTAGSTVTTTEDNSVLVEKDNQQVLFEEQEDVPDIPDEPNQEDRLTGQQLGASQGKENQSEGTSIGVVVTVGLVAALVFFILGFIASKYWSGRRETTFNVRKADRQKCKNTPVEITGIEYRDVENNKSKGIYDEIPANVNGSSSDKKPINAPETDNVYSKPIKRDTVPVTNAGVSPSPVTDGAREDIVDGEWAGFTVARHSSSGSLILLPPPPPRPTSDDNQYVEEDGRGDKSAMPESSPVCDTVDETSPATSRKPNSNIKHDPDITDAQDMSDERTPMLERSSESHTS